MQLKLNDAVVLDGLNREQIELVYCWHPRQSDRRILSIRFLLILFFSKFVMKGMFRFKSFRGNLSGYSRLSQIITILI